MGYQIPVPVASGYTFAQLQAAGFSGLLEAVLAAQVATAKPTVALTVATGTTYGGLLPAGVYYGNFSETNGIGETLPSAESATFTLTQQAAPSATATGAGSTTGGSLPTGTYIALFTYVDALGGETGVGTSVSAGIAITNPNILTITFNDSGLPTGIVSRNLYLTAAGGAAGTATLYKTGITTATYVATSASWTNGTTTQSAAVSPPTVNTTSTNLPVATFPALQTGNVARNLYLTAPGGAAGSEVLYQSGITSTTYTMSKKPNLEGVPALPTVNTTALSSNGKMIEFARCEESRRPDRVFDRARMVLYDFLRGAPVSQEEAIQRFREAHSAVAMWAEVFSEAGVLMDANPGRFTYVQTGIGGTGSKRVWP